MGSLSNLYISQSYQSLIHVGTNNTASTTFTVLQDGLGNSLGVSINTLGEISASGNIYGLNITGSSVNTGSLVTTSSFNSYTSSTNGRLNSIEATTASLITSSSNALYTASFDNSTRNLTFTKGNTTQFSVNIPDVSGSAGTFVTTSSFNQYTQSVDSSISQLNASSASQQVSINALNTFTASQSTASLVTSITNLNTFTSSQLTINTAIGESTSSLNTFSGSQITKNSTLATYTASVDNKFTAVGASTSSLNTATASLFTSASLSLTTASVSLNTITFRKGDGTTFAITVNTGSSTSTDITALNSFTSSQLTINSAIGASTSSLNTFSSSVLTQLNTLANVTSSLISKTGSYATTGSNTFIGDQTITGNITAFSASFTYLQTIFESSSVIYSSGSNQFGDELSDVQTLSGSVKVQGSLTVNGTPVQTSSVDITALNAFTSSQLTINSAIGASTSSLNTATSSLFTSASRAITTASVSLNTITFTKGDGTTFPITVNTGSGGGGGAAFPYTGSAEISGSLKVIGNVQMSASAASNATVVSITPDSSMPILITGKGSMDYGLYISGSNLSADPASEIILVGNSRVRYAVFPATNASDRDVFVIQNNQPGRVGINGYIGTKIGYGYGSNNFNPNQIYISQSLQDTNGRNFIGFNAHPSSYVGSYNYVFEAANPAQGGARTAIQGHLYVSQSFTASLQNGYAWVGNSTGYNVQVTTSSFATPIPTGTISGSQQITSLGFVSSSVTASSLVTASFTGNTLTFTKGDASTFGIVLPDVSGSTIDTGSFVTTSSFNAYTASQSTASLVTSITNLNTFSASALVSISNLNSTTSSLNISVSNLNTATASLFTSTSLSLTTASFAGNTLTFRKGDGTTFGVVIPDVSGSTINTGSFATTGSNAFFGTNTFSGAVAFTGSAPTILSSSFSGSIITNLTDIYTDVSAVQQIVTLTSASYAALASGSLTNPNTLYIVSGSTAVPDITSLNAFTASQLTINSGYNTFTASQLTINSAIGASTSSLNSATASLFTSASLALVTASFDNGTRNLTFTKGNTTQFSVNIPDASGSAPTTIYDTVYTGESITKGDPLYISGSQGANPIVFKADAAVPAKMPVTYVSNQTIGAGTTTEAIILGHIEGVDLTGYTAGQSIYVAEGGGWSASLPSGSASITQLLGVVTKGGSGGKGLVLNPGPAQLPGLDTGKMWVGNGNNQPVEITTASFASSASFNSYTSSTNSRLTNIESTTASLLIETQNLETFSASALISISNLNTTTASLLIETSNLESFSSSALISLSNINTATASLFTSASLGLTTASFAGNTLTFRKGDGTTFGVVIPDVSGSTLPAGTISGSAQITSLGFVSSSVTASSLVTASVSLNTITFTKGDGTTFPITVNTGSGGGSTYTGSLMVTGSVTGNVLTFTKGDTSTFSLTVATGSGGTTIPTGTISGSAQITALGFVSSSVTASSIVTASVAGNVLTFTEGDGSTFSLTVATGSGGGGAAFPYSGSAEITGSLKVKPFTLTVASSTASINMNESNYFILNLPTSSTTHVAFTNITPGESINLLVSQSATVATGSITFAPNIYFSNGSDYQATATGSAKDVVSFITFNSNEIYATQVKNLY